MGPYQRTPKLIARAVRYSGLGVRSVGPVADFLEPRQLNTSGPAISNLSKPFKVDQLCQKNTTSYGDKRDISP